MERKSLVAALALTVLPAFTASAATTFSFAGTLEGSNFGTFAAPFDLSPGTYDLSALGRFSLNFFFGPELTFSTMDIVTPLDQVAVKITPFAPGVESLVFVPTCCNKTVYIYRFGVDEFRPVEFALRGNPGRRKQLPLGAYPRGSGFRELLGPQPGSPRALDLDHDAARFCWPGFRRVSSLAQERQSAA